MIELSETDIAQLDDEIVQPLYHDIVKALVELNNPTIDYEKTSFHFVKGSHSMPDTVECTVRRIDKDDLDLDIIICGEGPRLEVGPSSSYGYGWNKGTSYRLWEFDWIAQEYNPPFVLNVALEQCMTIVRAWLDGRITIEIEYAGRKARRWTMHNDERVLGMQKEWFFNPFAKRRVETIQSTVSTVNE